MIGSPMKSARDSFLKSPLPFSDSTAPPPPCTTCCCGIFRCLSTSFSNTPSPKSFHSSHLMSQGFLMLFRIVIFIYLFTVGFLMEWTPLGGRTWDEIYNSSPSRYSESTASNAPYAYLTNWGFCSVVVYFFFATYWSISNYSRRGAHHRQSTPNLDPKKGFAPLSVMTSNYASSRATTLHAVTWYFFTLAATVQPFIVVGFWGLVFPYDMECNYQCGTVHGAAWVCIYIELVVSKLTIDKSLLPWVVLYPATWLVSQLLWILVFDLKPDYEILPMDNWLSLFLSIGSMAFFCFAFFQAKWITEKRDKRWAFPGGVSGRDGPPASKYFSDGVLDSDDEGRHGLLIEEGTISF
ncbi:hypothetical protein TrVE_jg8120 [Triparma verrucosa]|uniref:Uncharacterized protein n=2 Tax=Triparma TaxID=722752 RepID=A0A9W7BQP7_9STRA|nr:hypothetical protein TrVE_jg8120 [Triparma verrucosa]GMH92325.1 hypothetical protein TrST_g2886 [Triparma strigata]